MTSHQCPAAGCQQHVSAAQLMCLPHWYMVSKPLRSAVYTAWDKGRGAGSAEHAAAILAAVSAANTKLAAAEEQHRCRSPQCAAPIIFAVVGNSTGRKSSRMPLDPEPNPEGNIACFRDAAGTLTGRVLAKGQEPAGYERRYMPHFATCTAPAEHRRPQQRRPAPSSQPDLYAP